MDTQYGAVWLFIDIVNSSKIAAVLGPSRYKEFQENLYNDKIRIPLEENDGAMFVHEDDLYIFKFDHANDAYKCVRAIMFIATCLLQDYPQLRVLDFQTGFKLALDASPMDENYDRSSDKIPALGRLKHLDKHRWLKRNIFYATEHAVQALHDCDHENKFHYSDYFVYDSEADLEWEKIKLYTYTEGGLPVSRDSLSTKVIIEKDAVRTLRVLQFTVLTSPLYELDMGEMPRSINPHEEDDTNRIDLQPSDIVSSMGVPMCEGRRIIVKFKSPLCVGDSHSLAMYNVIHGDYYPDPREECYGITWPNTQARQILEIYLPKGKKLQNPNAMRVMQYKKSEGEHLSDGSLLVAGHDYYSDTFEVTGHGGELVRGISFTIQKTSVNVGKIKFSWEWQDVL